MKRMHLIANILIPIALMIALAIACGGGSDKEVEVDPNVPLPKVGEVVTTKNFEIKVKSVTSRKSVGSQFLNQKASQGATYIAVIYEYKNVSGEPLSSYKLPRDPKLISPDGIKYEKDSGATVYYSTETKIDTKLLSKLNPGITSKDAIVYEVAVDSWKEKGWKLEIDADKKVLVQLNE